MSAVPFLTKRGTILYPLLVLGGISTCVFLGVYLWDFFSMHQAGNPISKLFEFDIDTLQNTLGSMAQTVAAVLGIVITVVSIVVQLAATRYTPRIADMFFRDRTTLAVPGFFVVVCINAVWVSVAVDKTFLPRVSIIFTMITVTGSLLIMVPYFAYVFDFLDPDRVVERIQREAVAAAIGERRRGEKTLADLQRSTLSSVEQLSDISVNAVSQKDKAIASGTVDAICNLLVTYLGKKRGIAAEWFTIGPELRRNPDFVALAPETVAEISGKRLWLEWKALRQYQTIYNEALGAMPDINYLIAINTRYIGEAALEADEPEVLAMAIKFFNTYMRATLNKGDVRTAYNLLHQYRHLVERAIVKAQDALVAETAGYFKYYGQQAHAKVLGFVTETVGYDLATLCERAFEAKSGAHDKILDNLLELDREAESQQQESMLRGVRRAQAKLASFYLAHDAEKYARRIFEDMHNETPERLRATRADLLRITSKDFWEVIDRGTNFDYIDPAQKEKLKIFFSWFPNLAPL